MEQNVIIWHILLIGIYLVNASTVNKSPEHLASPRLSAGPGVERRYACWGSHGPPVVSAQCPRGSSIHVVKTGLKVQQPQARCVFRDDDCGCEYGESGCNMPDVSQLCNGRSACRVDVTEQYIDNTKCKGFSGYMFIDFKCIHTPVSLPSQDINICQHAAANQKSGYIHSPNYPEKYPANQRCRCSLSSPPFTAIVISILDFHVDDYRCQKDVLQLQYAGHMSKLCAHSNGLTNHLNADTNHVQLTFTTDAEGAAEGFWIKYQAEPSAGVSVQCYSMTERIPGVHGHPPPANVPQPPPAPIIPQSAPGRFGIANRRASDFGIHRQTTDQNNIPKSTNPQVSEGNMIPKQSRTQDGNAPGKNDIPGQIIRKQGQASIPYHSLTSSERLKQHLHNPGTQTSHEQPLEDVPVLSGPHLPQVPLDSTIPPVPAMQNVKPDQPVIPGYRYAKKSTFEVNLIKSNEVSNKHLPTDVSRERKPEPDMLLAKDFSKDGMGPKSLQDITEDEDILFGFKSSEHDDWGGMLNSAENTELESHEEIDKATPPPQVTLEIVQKPVESRMDKFSKQGPEQGSQILAEPQMLAQAQKGPLHLMVDDNWMKYENLPQGPQIHPVVEEDGPQFKAHPHPKQGRTVNDILNIRRNRHGIRRPMRYHNPNMNPKYGNSKPSLRLKPSERNAQQQQEAEQQVPNDNKVEEQEENKSEKEDTTKPWWWNFQVTTPQPMVTEPPKTTTSEILKKLEGKKDDLIPEYYYYMDYKGKGSKEIPLDDDSYESSEEVPEEQSQIPAPAPADVAEDSKEASQSVRGQGVMGLGLGPEQFRGLSEAQRRKLRLIQAQMSIIRKQLAGVQAAKKLASEMEKDAKSSVDAVTNSLNSLGELDPTLLPSIPTLKPVYPSFYEQPMVAPDTKPVQRYAPPVHSGRYQVLLNELHHSMSTETPSPTLDPMGMPFGLTNQVNIPKIYPYHGLHSQQQNPYQNPYNNLENKYFPMGGYVAPTYSTNTPKAVLENSLSQKISELLQNNVNPTEMASVTTMLADLGVSPVPGENNTLSESEDGEKDSEEAETENRFGRRKKIRISKKRKIIKATEKPNDDSDEEPSQNRFRNRGRFLKRGQDRDYDDDNYRRGRGPTRGPFDEPQKEETWRNRKPNRNQNMDDPLAKMRAIYNSGVARPQSRDTAKPANRSPWQVGNRPPVSPIHSPSPAPVYNHPAPPGKYPGGPGHPMNPAGHPRVAYTTPAPVHSPLVPATHGSHKVHPVDTDGSKQPPTGEAKKLEEETDNITVSLVAGGVAGAIIIVVTVALVVRHFMNKKARENAMRQRHKRECAMRRTIQQRHGPAPNKP